MFTKTRHFLELIRFSHTVFALPFALLAAVMAWKLDIEEDRPLVAWGNNVSASSAKPILNQDGNHVEPLTLDGIEMITDPGKARKSLLPGVLPDRVRGFHWQQLTGILMCMVFARSAAMAFNRLADRAIDADNPGTARRHLPAGLLSAKGVWFFALLSCAGFIASTLLFWPNRLPLYLSLPVLLFLLGYSYTKRFTSLAHFWLGAALMLAPVSAWIAVRGETVLSTHGHDLWPALVLGGAVLLWVAGFDMIYACQDVTFDKGRGLHSIPAALGVPAALKLAAFCHLGTVGLLFVLPQVYPLLGWIYYAGVGAVTLLLIVEHALVRPHDLSRVNAAFFNVNAVISLGLLAVGIADLYLR